MTAKNNEHYDVGIVGVGVGANYGSVLTYYSLYKTIENLGNKVLMVAKIGASADDPEIQNTHAMAFAREHYNLSKVYSQANVGELNSITDTFVIGSDQVWNYGIARNFGKAFYLDFANDSKRKLSYAASFGHAKDFAPAEEIESITSLMKRFNDASVREDSGVKIARDIYGVPVTQVAEPIFLTALDHYVGLAHRSEREVSGEDYLLAYILDPTPEKKAAIEHLASKMGLKVRIILDAWPHLLQENKAKMDMPESVEEDVNAYDFLKLYHGASYVVTDSFHGTAFSIKFQKPFASIGNRRRGVTRFDSMFRLIGHRQRFTLSAEEIVTRDQDFLAPLDYTSINSQLDQHVHDSKDWLKKALKRPVNDTIASRERKAMSRAALARTKLHRVLSASKQQANAVKLRFTGQRFVVDNPEFSSNNASWSVTKRSHGTLLNVVEPSFATERGNFVWTDLPAPLQAGDSYELTIDWSPHTTSPVINVHLRNPNTAGFKVIGKVKVAQPTGAHRRDSITFTVPESGLSQVMFGAMHFRGKNGGMEIDRIALTQIPASRVAVPPSSRPAPSARKSAAATVREMGHADDTRFINAYAQHRVARSVENARSLLVFYSHGFEKGLSRRGTFRPGFGKDSMPHLAKEMNAWIAQSRDTQDSFFQIAASVMHAYFERHRELGVDVEHFWKLFDGEVQEYITNADASRGGAFESAADRDVKVSGLAPRSFEDVVFSRRSVREFTSEKVADDDITRAVSIAMQAPSVCNRQPVRVHQIEDQDVMKDVLELQGGFRGYEMPPKLLLVTSDHAAFVGAVERNQAYIDGGLFMMLLLLGLEEVGLGAVSLNTAMSLKKEATIRDRIGISDNEVFISFIAVGHFEPDVLVPRSQRVEPAMVLTKHSGQK